MDKSIFFNTLSNCFNSDLEQEMRVLWLQNSLNQIYNREPCCGEESVMLARGQCNAIFALLVGPFQLSVFLGEMKHSIVHYRVFSFIMVFI